jgi:4-hydroxy-2-oxoheptanedioate aldolase
MRANNVRTVWSKGEAALNGWLSIPSPVSAENMAQTSWDSLTIDLQHGLIDYATALGMLQAICTTSITPLARVPWFEPGIIGKMLDAGAYGIICPMINSAADCEAFVGACRYAPRGYRSVGPTRAAWYGGTDYVREADSTVLTFAMIETRKALDNLDEILAVPGLDGIYVGGADLSMSLGHGLNPQHPDVVEAIKQVCARVKRTKVKPGVHSSSTGHAKELIAMGYEFVSLPNDNIMLGQAAKAAVAATREGSRSS